MDWVTAIWSAAAGGCLVLGLLHLAIWCGSHRSWASLWFVVIVAGVMCVMAFELMIMHAKSTEVVEGVVRWAHVVFLFICVGVLGFVDVHFRSGRRWLLWSALGLRIAAVVANFTTGTSLHLIAVHSLRKMTFLGQEVTVLGEWTRNPWLPLGQFASLVWLCYVVDASLRLWRSGDENGRRRALLLGGALVLFIVFAAAIPGLVVAGLIKMPMNSSVPFFAMVLAIGYELSRDALRSARLAKELDTSRQRLALAAVSARLALWEWDVTSGQIWVSDEGRELYGVPKKGPINFEMFVATLHPDDRPAVIQRMNKALGGLEMFTGEYRVIHGEGKVRWIAATGKIERDEQGRAVLMRGVSLDCAERKRTEAQTERQRQELAHLSRVSVLGELAGALAHELNQPLAAMLSNSKVGRRSLDDPAPNLTEMAAIFDDIAVDAQRAGGIIHGMRAMIRKDASAEIKLVELNEVVEEVLVLLNSQIVGHRSKVSVKLDPGLPRVLAGRVELQQVLINLLVNGLDAMKGQGGGALWITTTGREGKVSLTVRDSGPGIPAELTGRLFEPFFSTKPNGLGLGLAISRSIMENFAGELVFESCAEGGTIFRMVLPAAGG
jgi:two-component system sensor kinase FixL